MSCKVRFAPSPTGFMHVGNARIAIINHLFCQKNNGNFLFRIDDTDALRSKKEYENAIKSDMSWLGIGYDETFRQSERLDRYHEVMEKLISDGLLYKCFETPEELEYKRKLAISKGQPPVYDRAALSLTDAEIKGYEREGRIPYWRFRLPNKTVSWNDLILGEISYNLNSVSDPVIIKADGTFLYTYSSVVDDFDSGITHIIRGQDHVTNTAVQIAMFDAISKGTYQVSFAHLSLLVNKDGSQFSKRLGSMNLGDLREQGVDPMAILDLLATLGSSLDTIPFTKIDDLIEYFDISKFSTNSPKFDIDDIFKISRKILHSKPFPEVAHFGISEEAYAVIKNNIDSYNDFPIWREILQRGFRAQFIPTTEETKVLQLFFQKISAVNNFSKEDIEQALNSVKTKLNVSNQQLYHPIRKMLTSKEKGPNIIDLMMALGKNETLQRIGRHS